MGDIILLVLALIFCFVTGTVVEKNHYKRIKERESKIYKYPYMTYGKNFARDPKIKKSFLVTGSVVLGCDFFKSFLAGLKNTFGGNVSAYESVLDRGRREALLRMRESAFAQRAHAVINVKLETVMLDPLGSNGNPKVCVTAYGTAIKYDK